MSGSGEQIHQSLTIPNKPSTRPERWDKDEFIFRYKTRQLITPKPKLARANIDGVWQLLKGQERFVIIVS